jgi:hypothetical protein
VTRLLTIGQLSELKGVLYESMQWLIEALRAGAGTD